MTTSSASLVSIIIPAYNAAPFIGRAVRSALEQTHHPVEVLVIDDGSTDDTASQVEALCKIHPEVRLISTPNHGVSHARNVGLAESRGDYLAFLDADDILLPQGIEILLTHLLATDADVCGGQFCGDTADQPETGLCQVFQGADALRLCLLDRPESYSACSKLFTRKAVEHIRFPENAAAHEDSFFVFSCFAQGITFSSVNRYVYRVYPVQGSASRSTFSAKKLSILALAEQKEQIILRDYPQLSSLTPHMRIRACMATLHLLLYAPPVQFFSVEQRCLRYIYSHKKSYIPQPDLNDDWFRLLARHGYYFRRAAALAGMALRHLLRR